MSVDSGGLKVHLHRSNSRTLECQYLEKRAARNSRLCNQLIVKVTLHHSYSFQVLQCKYYQERIELGKR